MQSKQLLLPNQTWDVLCMNVSKMYDQWLLPISLQLSYGQQETRRALRGVHLDNLTQCDVPHFQYTYDRTMKPRRQSPSVLRPSNAVFSNTCLAVSKRLKQTIELCTYTCRNKKKCAKSNVAKVVELARHGRSVCRNDRAASFVLASAKSSYLRQPPGIKREYQKI